MKKPWSDDSREITEVINTLVNAGKSVALCANGEGTMHTRLLRVHYHRGQLYLLVRRPSGLAATSTIHSLIFKLKGMPALGFTCRVEKETENLLAAALPEHIFQLELRKESRLRPLHGSMATFFIQEKDRVNICLIEDISRGGARLVGRPKHRISNGDLIGPCTLSFAGHKKRISREITINTASVIRTFQQAGKPGHLGLGLRFNLSPQEKARIDEALNNSNLFGD